MKDAGCGCATPSCSCAQSDSPKTAEQKKALIDALRAKGLEPIPTPDTEHFNNSGTPRYDGPRPKRRKVWA